MWYSFVVIVIFFLLLSVGFSIKGLFYRTKKGRFRLKAISQSNNLLMLTDYGQFMIDKANQCIRIRSVEKKDATVPFGDIKGLRYEFSRHFAVLPEMLFGGLPLLKKYEDTYEWYHVYIVLRDGTEIPVYSVGNYEQRGFAIGWRIHLEKILMNRMGLYEDIETRSRKVLTIIQESFQSADISARLL